MTEITDLPVRTLADIFALLPLDSREAFQLSRVCRYFKTVITSSYFIHLHLKKNPMNNPSGYLLINSWSPECMLCISNRTFERRLEIRLPEDIMANLHHDLAVYGSYNGLLCISRSVLHVDAPIYLWNPSIRKIRQLPHGLINRATYNMGNDCDYRVTLGFGCNLASWNVDYKVIKFVQHAKTFRVEIYSLNANTWVRVRVRGLPRLLHDAKISPKCAYLNGVVYWAIHALNKTKLFTISFDLHTEQFKVKRYPDLSPLMYPNCLQVWNNSLCFFRDTIENEEYYWHILTLGLEPYTITPFRRILMPGSLTIPWPLGLNTDGSERHDYAIRDQHSILVSYTGSGINEIALTVFCQTWYVDVYKESLLLLN